MIGTTINPVTIAMVTYNSREHIEDCLKWFADRPADIRVRVRDNGSTDSTPAILRRLPQPPEPAAMRATGGCTSGGGGGEDGGGGGGETGGEVGDPDLRLPPPPPPQAASPVARVVAIATASSERVTPPRATGLPKMRIASPGSLILGVSRRPPPDMADLYRKHRRLSPARGDAGGDCRLRR